MRRPRAKVCRICVVCGEEFQGDTSAKSCSEACWKTREKARKKCWQESHPELVRAYTKSYRELHPEAAKASQKRYRKAHPEAEKARNAKPRKRNVNSEKAPIELVVRRLVGEIIQADLLAPVDGD